MRVGPHLLYGDQPYGFTSSGTVASLQGITRDQLKAFWSSHYGPSDSALVFAGDITESQARALAERHFGKWSSEAKAEVALPTPPPAPALRLVLVDKPGSPQTALFAYGFGVPRSTPDLQALQMMNFTLGASFGSRVNMNLREVHGYTYGARTTYSLYREGGPFLAGALVRTDVTAPATKELLLELKRIQTDPPTPEELKMARDANIQSIPAQFETTGATAGAVSSLFVYNRPLNYFATLPDAFRAVTPEAVEKVAKTDVHPDHLLIVAVGDKAKIEASLKELNLAPIEYADASGNPLPASGSPSPAANHTAK
jgi:zinc protease